MTLSQFRRCREHCLESPVSLAHRLSILLENASPPSRDKVESTLRGLQLLLPPRSLVVAVGARVRTSGVGKGGKRNGIEVVEASL